jgi:hypothetical protein
VTKRRENFIKNFRQKSIYLDISCPIRILLSAVRERKNERIHLSVFLHRNIWFYEAIEEGTDIKQGNILWYAAMKKDSRAEKTSGWIFDGFNGKTLNSVVENPASGCFTCHAAQQSNDYIFSKYVP